MNVACACDETRSGRGIDRRENASSDCSHAESAHAAYAVDFETKLETSRGFIGNGDPPPPPPPVYALAKGRYPVYRLIHKR